jgi:hypothetical protein
MKENLSYVHAMVSRKLRMAQPDGRQVCVHAFIGKLADGTIATYQTLPWNYVGWHSGGTANNTHIGFEICEDGLDDKDYFGAVYKEAIKLCVYLCRKFDLNTEDIIDHSEGHKLGIAGNHADVSHWFKRHGKTMDDFRADVLTGLEPPRFYRVQLGAFKEKANAEKMLIKLKNAGFKDTFIKFE